MEKMNLLSQSCDRSYCPASYSIRSVTICENRFYYLSYIPHFHDPHIYRGTFSTLPSFCQKVVYSYSGLQYLDHVNKLNSSSSVSSIIQYISEEKYRQFVESCKNSLQECARNTLNCEIDNEVNLKDTFDGKRLIIYKRIMCRTEYSHITYLGNDESKLPVIKFGI